MNKKSLPDQKKNLVRIIGNYIDHEEGHKILLKRKLHAEVYPTIISLKFLLSELNDHISEKRIFQKTLLLLDNIIENYGSVSSDLGPSHLNTLGLEKTLQNLVRTAQRSSDKVITFSFEQTEYKQTLIRELIIYKVFKKLLDLLLEYSGAARIEINVKSSGKYTELVMKHDCIVNEISFSDFKNKKDKELMEIWLLYLNAELENFKDEKQSHFKINIPTSFVNDVI
jgi:signal transduction histidine kinase